MVNPYTSYMNLYPNTDLETGKKKVFNYNTSKYTYYQNFVDIFINNYVSIFIIFFIIIIIILFYKYIYNNIIKFIFSNTYIQKKNISNFNQISTKKNYIYNNKLFTKNSYDSLFKDNINSYKKNLNKRLLYIKNNIDISINYYLSQSKPNYNLILYMKKYKDTLNLINTNKIINIVSIENKLQNINNKIINLLLN